MADEKRAERLDRLLRGYFEIIDEDLKAAEVLAQSGLRNAAYFVHQALEKLAKAALVRRDEEPGRDHDLTDLLSRLPDGDQTRVMLWPLRGYSSFATSFRYPTPGGRVPSPPPTDQLLADIMLTKEHATRIREVLLPPRDPPKRPRR
jgi:hypothetical protein